MGETEEIHDQQRTEIIEQASRHKNQLLLEFVNVFEWTMLLLGEQESKETIQTIP